MNAMVVRSPSVLRFTKSAAQRYSSSSLGNTVSEKLFSPLGSCGNNRRETGGLFTTAMLAVAGVSTVATLCDGNTLSAVGDDSIAEKDTDSLPEFTSEEVATNNGQDGKPIWMSYGGMVYNVTGFVRNHPGGTEKILQASGSAIEPFWHLYRQHFASDLPMKLMEHMLIGKLKEEDQDAIDEQMAALEEDDPYAREPPRHSSLVVHSETPMNAEVPVGLLTKSYLTPNSLFYIRHHHPVPFLSQKQIHEYKLKIDLTALGKGVFVISLDDLKKLPKTEVTTTLQCSGNRRSNFNEVKRTSGTAWGQGAISTAKWGGVKLAHILKLAGVDDPVAAEETSGMEHVRFYSLDGMQASIGIEKACNPYGDVLVAYEMNGDVLPRDHGFPLRMIVPGYSAVRNVKWVNKIELSETEAEGPWQRGLNYKTLPPSITDASKVNIEKMPSMMEVSLFSGITNMKISSPSEQKPSPGEKVKVKTSGWAWSGGGRKIVRVDITGDDGRSWTSANLLEGSEQKYGRAWAWTFWECEVPATVKPDGRIELASKAVDASFNVQPESSNHSWNVRGLGNNSWFRVSAVI